MSPFRCHNCGAARGVEDNFCRRCGKQITVNLPAIRSQSLPTGQAGLPAVRGSLPPTVLRGLAALAIGTGLEWAARRLASNATRGITRALIQREPTKKPKASNGGSADAVAIDEVVYIRQVHLRR